MSNQRLQNLPRAVRGNQAAFVAYTAGWHQWQRLRWLNKAREYRRDNSPPVMVAQAVRYARDSHREMMASLRDLRELQRAHA